MTIDERLSAQLASGALERRDVAMILRWQLSLPAGQMNTALASACARALEPELPESMRGALMTQLLERRRANRLRRALWAALAIALALLAACLAARWGTPEGTATVALERASFSSACGAVTLRVGGMNAAELDGVLRGDVLAVGADGRRLTARYARGTENVPDGARLTVEIEPPDEAWPGTLRLALPRRDGLPDWTLTLAVR